jgi:subtilisin family serine protease
VPFLAALLAALVLALPAHAAGDVVLRLQPETSRADAERLAERYGATVLDAIPQLDAYLLTALPAAAARSLAARPLVRSVEPNGADSLAAGGPPYRGSDWHLQATRVPEVWPLTRGDSSVTVAILDTGVDLDRPELAANLVPGVDVANDDDEPRDRNGHGTFVAGLVASNGFVTGVCPLCSIMPIKVVADGSTEAPKFDSAEGIIWAVEHGADVVNLSFGGSERSGVQEDAVRYALHRGVVVVAAAGNERSATEQFPAAYDGVIAVGATDDRDRVWSGSSYGSWVDLGAPGSGLFSLALEGGVERRSGTSFATPIVAGIAALLRSYRPALGGSELASALQAGTVPLPEGARQFDRGRLDAALAVGKASLQGLPTLSITRFALSPEGRFVRRYGEARAGRAFAAAAVVVRDDTGELVATGGVACSARIGSRELRPVVARFRAGVALCAWKVPASAGERWIEGTLTADHDGFQATQPFRVKAKKPLARRPLDG